jgi:hypothetical protein
VKESFPRELAKSADAVTGVVRIILGERVDVRGRNWKWFGAGGVAR